MKKKIASLLCAAMLMMALPTLAWANGSPANNTTASDNATSIVVSSPANTDDGGVEVTASSKTASSYVPTANDVLVSTYEITTWGELKGQENVSVSMTFNVGTQYAGWTARIYVQHNDGTEEAHTATVAADGTVTFSMDRLSYVTIAIEANQTPAAGTASAGVDKGAKSPQTGVDFAGVAGATAVMAVAAGAVAVTLRKKVTE